MSAVLTSCQNIRSHFLLWLPATADEFIEYLKIVTAPPVTAIASVSAIRDVGFSNRPFGVKHFQTIHHHRSVDVTHGLALLFGIGTKALPSMGFEDEAEPSSWTALPPDVTVGPSRHANSPHPSSREGTSFHRSVELEFSSYWIGSCTAFMLLRRRRVPGVQRNSVPSTQMRCMYHGQPARREPRSPFSSRGAWRSASPRP